MKKVTIILLLSMILTSVYGQTEILWDSITGETTIITRVSPITTLPYKSKKIPDKQILLEIPDTIKIKLNTANMLFKQKVVLPKNDISVLIFDFGSGDKTDEGIFIVHRNGGVSGWIDGNYYLRNNGTIRANRQFMVDEKGKIIVMSYGSDNKKTRALYRRDRVYKLNRRGILLPEKDFYYESKYYLESWLNNPENNIWEGGEKIEKTNKVSSSEQEFYKKSFEKVLDQLQ